MAEPGRKPEVNDVEILTAIALHRDPVVTAGEVADTVGMSPQGVNKRLRDLAEQGDIVRKQVGSRAVIYWLTPQGRDKLPAP